MINPVFAQARLLSQLLQLSQLSQLSQLRLAAKICARNPGSAIVAIRGSFWATQQSQTPLPGTM